MCSYGHMVPAGLIQYVFCVFPRRKSTQVRRMTKIRCDSVWSRVIQFQFDRVWSGVISFDRGDLPGLMRSDWIRGGQFCVRDSSGKGTCMFTQRFQWIIVLLHCPHLENKNFMCSLMFSGLRSNNLWLYSSMSFSPGSFFQDLLAGEALLFAAHKHDSSFAFYFDTFCAIWFLNAQFRWVCIATFSNFSIFDYRGGCISSSNAELKMSKNDVSRRVPSWKIKGSDTRCCWFRAVSLGQHIF